MNITHYAVLQVSENASVEVINAAWKALQRKFHPDSGAGDADMSKLVNHAHDVLTDPKQRAAYDQEIAAQRQFEAFTQTSRGRHPFQATNWNNNGYSTGAAYPDPMYGTERPEQVRPETVEDYFRMGMSNAGFSELAQDLSQGMTEQVIGLIYHRLSPALREPFLKVVNQYRSVHQQKRRAG